MLTAAEHRRVALETRMARNAAARKRRRRAAAAAARAAALRALQDRLAPLCASREAWEEARRGD